MKSKFSSERVVTPLLAILLISLVPALAEARIDLSVLQQQGYGVVEIKRPQPNTLAVEATINGHAAVLILDTGWSGHGITLDSESAGALKTPLSSVDTHTESLSGKKLSGYKKG